MDTRQQQRKRLTDEEMARIKAAIDEGGVHMGWVRAVQECFKCFGVDLDDTDGPRIYPGDYAIPEDQWGTIATWCDETGNRVEDLAGNLTRVNRMLDFMNYGPSGYKED